MPIRSGAMQRPRERRCGNTLRQRYDEVGLPCSSTIGSPFPTSTYAISRPRTRRRCFWYGNAAEITLPSIVVASIMVGFSFLCRCGFIVAARSSAAHRVLLSSSEARIPDRSRSALSLRPRWASVQGVEHPSGGAEIRRIEPLGELTVGRRENLLHLFRSSLRQSQPRQAHGAPQLPEQGALLSR